MDIVCLACDCARLPVRDGCIDMVVSNGGFESMQTKMMDGFREGYRVLKPGGVCLCLSARKGLHCTAPCLEKTEKEKAFWESILQSEDDLEKFRVCRFPMSESEIPASMEKNGFIDVITGYAVIDLTPDAPKYSADMAERMIEAMHQMI